MRYACVNAEGLNEGVLEMDARSAAAHPLPPGWRLLKITREQERALKFVGHGARHDERIGWHAMPEAHVRARKRGLAWEDRLEAEKHQRTLCRSLGGQLACLAPPPDDMVPPPPIVRVHPTPSVEVRPGLWIREMTAAEAVAFADQLVGAGIYDEPEDESRARAAVWFDDPQCWPMTVSWQGRNLSFETYHFTPQRPAEVRVGFNVRLQRDRTYRFWREVFTPMFQRLHELGVMTVHSRVRADRPEYLQGLIETYGASRIGGDAQWATLLYGVDATLAKSQGFPTMRTAAPGWSYQTPLLTIREATPEEIVTLRDTVAGLWRLVPGAERALQIFDDWMALDAATPIVGLAEGEIRHVRLVRERRPTVSSVAGVTPFSARAEALEVWQGVRAWHQAAGYQRATTFITDEQWAHPRVQQVLGGIGAATVSHRGGVRELEIPV
jgi:hypothetical protein